MRKKNEMYENDINALKQSFKKNHNIMRAVHEIENLPEFTSEILGKNLFTCISRKNKGNVKCKLVEYMQSIGLMDFVPDVLHWIDEDDATSVGEFLYCADKAIYSVFAEYNGSSCEDKNKDDD